MPVRFRQAAEKFRRVVAIVLADAKDRARGPRERRRERDIAQRDRRSSGRFEDFAHARQTVAAQCDEGFEIGREAAEVDDRRAVGGERAERRLPTAGEGCKTHDRPFFAASESPGHRSAPGSGK